jgi:hypothetical protein
MRRWRRAKQALAHQQVQHHRQLSRITLGGGVQSRFRQLRIQRRRQVLFDTDLMRTAQRFAARLLQRIENCPVQQPAGCLLRMHARVVVAHPQRHAVGRAARATNFLVGQVLGGQLDLALAGILGIGVGLCKLQLQLAVTRQRPRRRACRALEFLDRCGVAHVAPG